MKGEPSVLIVDDNVENLQVLLAYLNNSGYKLLVAENGENALRQLEHVHPDLILLDVLMPGIDGFETCRRLKANPATREIPVIFVTALNEPEHKLKGFEFGGIDYITKPFQVEEVLARVHAHVTVRKLQRELRQKNAELEELNASKDKFFSILAHDLKNPLIGFLSFAKFMEEGFAEWGKEQIQELAQQFREAAENLFALLENLLTWSRIQQGGIEYIPQDFPLGIVVVRNIDLLMPNARQKQLTLTNRVPELMPVDADLNMLDTIVRNLLSNAIKFTASGGTVEIAATHDEQTVTVTVRDTGIGIPAEKLPNLFRIDAKCQRAGTAGEKGTGLGLILCKEFVEKNGGRIWVASEVDQGTTFAFTLPKHP